MVRYTCWIYECAKAPTSKLHITTQARLSLKAETAMESLHTDGVLLSWLTTN